MPGRGRLDGNVVHRAITKNHRSDRVPRGITGAPEHAGAQDHRRVPGDRLLPAQVRQARHRPVYCQHDSGRRRHIIGAAASAVERVAQSPGRGAARRRAAARDGGRFAPGARDSQRPAVVGVLPRTPQDPWRTPDRHDRLLGQQQGRRAGIRALGAAERTADPGQCCRVPQH